jgi:hypothetical protein
MTTMAEHRGSNRRDTFQLVPAPEVDGTIETYTLRYTSGLNAEWNFETVIPWGAKRLTPEQERTFLDRAVQAYVEIVGRAS